MTYPSNHPDEDDDKVTYSFNKKFDFQLSQGVIAERDLARMFVTGKVEVKCESHLWEYAKSSSSPGRICIEYRHAGRLSGISTTEAEVWAHQLTREGKVIATIMLPIERLKMLCRSCWKDPDLHQVGRGDKGLSSVIYLPIERIFQ